MGGDGVEGVGLRGRGGERGGEERVVVCLSIYSSWFEYREVDCVDKTE